MRVGVDLLALHVPHLLVAAQVGVGVERLADLILAGQDGGGGEKRHSSVVGVLRAHATGDVDHTEHLKTT